MIKVLAKEETDNPAVLSVNSNSGWRRTGHLLENFPCHRNGSIRRAEGDSTPVALTPALSSALRASPPVLLWRPREGPQPPFRGVGMRGLFWNVKQLGPMTAFHSRTCGFSPTSHWQEGVFLGGRRQHSGVEWPVHQQPQAGDSALLLSSQEGPVRVLLGLNKSACVDSDQTANWSLSLSKPVYHHPVYLHNNPLIIITDVPISMIIFQMKNSKCIELAGTTQGPTDGKS